MGMVRVPSRLKTSRSYNGSSSGHSRRSSLTNYVPTSPKAVMAAQSNGLLILKTQVIKARDLAAKDKHGTSDPYLVLSLGDARQSTVTIPKSLNPEWNETIELPVSGLQSLLLEVVCWDKDRIGKDYMGEFDIPLEDIFQSGATNKQATWYKLESRRTGKKKSYVTGEVLLEFSLYDPNNLSASPQQLLSKLLGIAANDLDVDDDSTDDEAPATRSGSAPEAEDSLEDEETPQDIDDESGTNDTPERKKRRRKLRRLKRKAKLRAYEFSGLSDLDGVLFLEISRITDLPPERNMTRTSFDMDPFVVTSLGKKTYKTKVVRHNLNPVYEDKLVFHVARHEKNYSVNFSVVDRDKLSGNDFVGTTLFPLEKVQSVAPEPDPNTGLYPLRDPESPVQHRPPMETKRSRFRLPLSRSSSSNSIQRLTTGQSLKKSASQTSLNGSQTAADSSTTSVPLASATSDPQMSQIVSHENEAEVDPSLRTFELPIQLKNKERWEEKHKPALFIRAKYMPYRAIRQQFWRAMLKQYDADDSGYMSKVELTSMLDTLGSTLHEATIDGFFERFDNGSRNGEPSLSFDQAVICLEDILSILEERKMSWAHRKHKLIINSQPPTPSIQSSQSMGYMTTRTTSNESDSSEPLNVKAEQTDIPAIVPDDKGSPGERGDTVDANDLGDERGEEHVIEIRECPICHQPRMGKRSDSDIITHIATCASQDWRQVNNLVMAGFVTSSQAQRKWYSKVITKIGYGGYKLGANSANILVQDRITGQINEERMSVYVRLGIRLLYKGLKSRDMEKRRIRKLLRSLSFKQGRKFDDPASAAEIQNFINFHQLDMSEVLHPVDEFKNFNEFFYRELKPDARPCSAPTRPEVVTSPADCRSVVFNKLDEAQTVWVKGREFSIARLLGNAYPEDAKRYGPGSALGIFRLAPQDYHRFHIPVDGVMGEPKLIEGEYYTVNPMAIRSALDVYGENIRILVPIDSVTHGRVMVVCVGAMMVGSTVITRKAGEHVKRAEELGYFKFGGSTLLVLFEKDRVVFDTDLTDNSSSALETLIRVGMSVGHSPGFEPHTPDMQKEWANVTHEEKQEAKRRIEGSLAPDEGGMGGAVNISKFK